MGRRSIGLLLVAVIAASLSACGVVLNAPEITFIVRDDRIVYSGPQDREALVAGEAKLILRNDGEQFHRIVLARFDSEGPAQLPSSMATAEFPRDDERILAITKDLEPKEATFAGGGIGYRIDEAQLHVHLRPGEQYILFDSLNRGADRGVYLELVPKRAP